MYVCLDGDIFVVYLEFDVKIGPNIFDITVTATLGNEEFRLDKQLLYWGLVSSWSQLRCTTLRLGKYSFERLSHVLRKIHFPLSKFWDLCLTGMKYSTPQCARLLEDDWAYLIVFLEQVSKKS